ncbi:SIR2 family protein [Archangium sp.]|uniref:SIR2 family protein n=1 Tax=Archangium sp. TaxID=1872627 RepID=UPI00389A0916
MNLPRELIEAVRRHQVVPFVGAGVSMGVKRELFPSWKQLLEGLAERLEQEALPEPVIAEVRQRIAGGDFLTAAELAFKELGAFRFNRFLRERLRVRRPTDADLSVVRALWALKPEVMLTTNYDDVLLWGREGTEPISNDQEDELHLMDAEASPDTPRLWYLHGTIHRLSTLILGGADYTRLYGDGTQQDGRYSHYTNALVRLRDWIRSKPFLYVGFSFSDPYVIKQLEHVLGITKGRQVPSFALMKKGSIERGALWPRYNIQLIEYEDHGPPLAACLNALARAAFGQPPAPASLDPFAFLSPGPAHPPPQAAPRAPVPSPGPFALESFSLPAQAGPSEPPVSQAEPSVPLDPPHVLRPALEQECARILRSEQRLVLLAPEEGGANSLARRVAAQYGKQVTWLVPPNLPECTETDYCRALAEDAKVTSSDALVAHLRKRAEGLGREHLLVLGCEWGPLGHLDLLGKHLLRLMEGTSTVEFHLLVAGGERMARLLHEAPESSVYKDAPRREVPGFTVDEVRQLLEGVGLNGSQWAGDVHEATGGHLGLLKEALLGAGALDRESVTARLVRSPSVRGALQERLREDERNGYTGRLSCRFVLEELLAGRTVEALEPLDHRTRYPEVRLFFAGLVRGDAQGKTVLRCQAVELVAREVLARDDARA